MARINTERLAPFLRKSGVVARTEPVSFTHAPTVHTETIPQLLIAGDQCDGMAG